MKNFLFIWVIVASGTITAIAQPRLKMDDLLSLMAKGSESDITKYLQNNLGEAQLPNLHKIKGDLLALKKTHSKHEVMNEEIEEDRVTFIIESIETRLAKEITLTLNSGKIQSLTIKDFMFKK